MRCCIDSVVLSMVLLISRLSLFSLHVEAGGGRGGGRGGGDKGLSEYRGTLTRRPLSF